MLPDLTDLPQDPDRLRTKLIEVSGLFEKQSVAFTAMQDQRDHFKVAFEEADAERQRLELVIRQLLRAQFGRKSERLDPDQFQLTLENLEQEIAAAKAAQEGPQGGDANRRPRRASARRHPGHPPAPPQRLGGGG